MRWFLTLSGWPVFLTVVAAVACFALVATVILQWASRRSVTQNAVLAVAALALIVALLLGIATFLSRAR